MFNEHQKRFDWFSLVLGILFVIAGFASFMHPDKTLHFLSILVGIAFIFRGIYELWFRKFINATLNERSGWIVFAAILDIILGVIVLVYPNWEFSTWQSCLPSGSSSMPSCKSRLPASSRLSIAGTPPCWLS